MRIATFTSSVALAIASLLCVGTSAQAQNLLTNGSMDATSISGQALATPTGWTASAMKFSTGPFNDAMSSEPWADYADAASANGVFFKSFAGGDPAQNNKLTAQLYQDVAGTAGAKYTLTGWAGAESNYVGLTDATVGTKLSLQFLNGSSGVISEVVLDLVPAGLGTGSPTAPSTNTNFKYHPFTVEATAPAGTVSVRSMITMSNAYSNPLGGAQALVADNFSLTVPEPTSVAVIGGASLLGLRRRRA